jgi:aldehyde dehydrogenase (NAD+)
MNSVAYLKPAKPAPHGGIAQAELLIDGHTRPAASGRYFESVDPATEQVIARVAEADSADIDAAVAAARAALSGPWGQMRAADRGQILLRLAELIRQDQDALIDLESLDSGKAVSAIRRQDLPAVLDTLTYYAGWADKINGQLIPARTHSPIRCVSPWAWSAPSFPGTSRS